MTPSFDRDAPSPALLAALAGADAQLRALGAGDHDAFLAALPAHEAACRALDALPLDPADLPALERLQAVTGELMAALDRTSDALRAQLARGRAGSKAAAAYLRDNNDSSFAPPGR